MTNLVNATPRGAGRQSALLAEAVPRANSQRARWDDVRPAEDGQDVVHAARVEGVEQVRLEGKRHVVPAQVEADREVGDGARLDAVGVEVAARVDHDVRRGEGVVRVGE